MVGLARAKAGRRQGEVRGSKAGQSIRDDDPTRKVHKIVQKDAEYQETISISVGDLTEIDEAVPSHIPAAVECSHALDNA